MNKKNKIIVHHKNFRVACFAPNPAFKKEKKKPQSAMPKQIVMSVEDINNLNYLLGKLKKTKW